MQGPTKNLRFEVDPPVTPGGGADSSPGATQAGNSPQGRPGDEPGEERGGTTPELFGQVYEQLRDLAHKRMSQERSDLTLQTTALVHEVYLRLMKDPAVNWENPRHFFGAAAESMRRILIERARRYAAHKHGGWRKRVNLDVVDTVGGASIDLDENSESASAMLELNDALADLKAHDEKLGEVVMLRYFAGLSVEETAAATGRSPRSVKRDWAFARAWLARRLNGDA